MPRMFTLSEVADNDLEEIFDYSYVNFGFDQAVIYLNEIDLVCDSIANQALMGILREEIDNDVRSFVYRYHIIFYRIVSEDLIYIERIIHGSRDITNQFTK